MPAPGKELPHRRRQDVRRGVTQHADGIGIALGDDRDGRVAVDRAIQVPDFAVHPRGERRSREPGPDRLGDLSRGGARAASRARCRRAGSPGSPRSLGFLHARRRHRPAVRRVDEVQGDADHDERGDEQPSCQSRTHESPSRSSLMRTAFVKSSNSCVCSTKPVNLIATSFSFVRGPRVGRDDRSERNRNPGLGTAGRRRRTRGRFRRWRVDGRGQSDARARRGAAAPRGRRAAPPHTGRLGARPSKRPFAPIRGSPRRDRSGLLLPRASSSCAAGCRPGPPGPRRPGGTGRAGHRQRHQQHPGSRRGRPGRCGKRHAPPIRAHDRAARPAIQSVRHRVRCSTPGGKSADSSRPTPPVRRRSPGDPT